MLVAVAVHGGESRGAAARRAAPPQSCATSARRRRPGSRRRRAAVSAVTGPPRHRDRAHPGGLRRLHVDGRVTDVDALGRGARRAAPRHTAGGAGSGLCSVVSSWPATHVDAARRGRRRAGRAARSRPSSTTRRRCAPPAACRSSSSCGHALDGEDEVVVVGEVPGAVDVGELVTAPGVALLEHRLERAADPRAHLVLLRASSPRTEPSACWYDATMSGMVSARVPSKSNRTTGQRGVTGSRLTTGCGSDPRRAASNATSHAHRVSCLTRARRSAPSRGPEGTRWLCSWTCTPSKEALLRRTSQEPTRLTCGAGGARRQLPALLGGRVGGEDLLPRRRPGRRVGQHRAPEAHGLVADEIYPVLEGS